MNMDYVLREAGAVLNWFDVVERPGYFSLNDKISDIMESKRGKLWFIGVGLKIKKKMDAGKKKAKGEKKSGGFDVDLKADGGLMHMMNVNFTKEELLKLNAKLNRIKKPKKKAQ